MRWAGVGGLLDEKSLPEARSAAAGPPGADSDLVILEEVFVLRLLQAASSLRGRR